MGSNNTASGGSALLSNVSGSNNTASGVSALYSNETGSNNIALGYQAGYNTTGSNNISIGNSGVGGESSAIRIGTQGIQTKAFMAGISGVALSGGQAVVVKSDGTIWFTDPPYGIISDHEGIRADSEIGNNQVYRFDPHNGELSVVADDFDRPNGLAFSPDESELYVADSGYARGSGFGVEEGRPRHVRGFRVVDGKRLAGSRVVATINEKVPDGLRVDTEGLLWISAGDGVHCYTKEGERLGRILVPEVVANLTFGGFGKSRMFICATSSVYAIETARTGAQWP
jgi:DNA-binding beta-propeller fold protein YncE